MRILLNEVNKELLMRLQESGIAVVSSTMLNGKFVLRAAITNHRSRREDFQDGGRSRREDRQRRRESDTKQGFRATEGRRANA
jgi:hypothetical protein